MQRLRIAGIEINAVMQCNLACAGCSHASPVASTFDSDPAVVYRDLLALRAVAEVSELRVVGGEPLLHPDLAGLLRAIRASRIGALVRLITNGTRLHRCDWDWLELVDEVYVSRYPGTSVRPAALQQLHDRGRAAGTRVAVNHYTHFRAVQPGQPLTAPETAAVFQTCQVAHAWSCHTVQEGYLYLCPMTVPGQHPDPASLSRCDLRPAATLPDRLRAFLEPSAPLPECRSCLGTVGELIPHQQANRRTWLAKSTAGIDWDQLARVQADPWADNGCVDNGSHCVSEPAEADQPCS